MGQGRREAEKRELGIRLRPDEELVSQLNTLVEAADQLEDAEGELRVFESRTEPPTARTYQFGSTEDLLVFNQRRREYLQEREDLRHRRDNADGRFQESADVVQVLLPTGCSLIHHYAGFRYALENRGGTIVVFKMGLDQQS